MAQSGHTTIGTEKVRQAIMNSIELTYMSSISIEVIHQKTHLV